MEELTRCLSQPCFLPAGARTKAGLFQGTLEMPQIWQWAGAHGHDTVNILADLLPERVWRKANNVSLLPGNSRAGPLQDGEGSSWASGRAWGVMSLVVFISITNSIFHF